MVISLTDLRTLVRTILSAMFIVNLKHLLFIIEFPYESAGFIPVGDWHVEVENYKIEKIVNEGLVWRLSFWLLNRALHF